MDAEVVCRQLGLGWVKPKWSWILNHSAFSCSSLDVESIHFVMLFYHCISIKVLGKICFLEIAWKAFTESFHTAFAEHYFQLRRALFFSSQCMREHSYFSVFGYVCVRRDGERVNYWYRAVVFLLCYRVFDMLFAAALRIKTSGWHRDRVTELNSSSKRVLMKSDGGKEQKVCLTPDARPLSVVALKLVSAQKTINMMWD